MRIMPAILMPESGPPEPDPTVADLIRRVEDLMEDKRYPPLYPVRVSLHIPFLIKYRRQ